MRLVEFIEKLRFSNSENLIKELGGDFSEEIEIYIKGSLNLESEIFFFPIEETSDETNFEKDGIKYIQLFPIGFFQDLIEDFTGQNKKISNSALAERLLLYRINDA